jgi:hypothetical protein
MTAQTPTARACAALNRQGVPCKAPPLSGRSHCAAHDHDSPFGTHEHAVAAGRLGGRPCVARPTEIAQRLLEEHVAELLRQAGLVPVYGENGHARAGGYAHNPSTLR